MEKTPVLQRVQLADELAELFLRKGQEGVLLNSWAEPTVAYEVEFEQAGFPMRVLLLGQQLKTLVMM